MDLGDTFFSVKGRMGRRDFWYAAAGLALAEIALIAFFCWSGDVSYAEYLYRTRRATMIDLAAFSFLFWPSLAVTVKRLHDRNTSGWWAGLLHLLAFLVHVHLALGPVPGRNRLATLIGLAPTALFILLGSWLIIELVFLRGTPGPNRYGPDPKAIQGRFLPPEVAAASAKRLAGESSTHS